MHTLVRTWLSASAVSLASLLLGASMALYAWAMVPRLLAELRYGPLCSGHPLDALHCPQCYMAAALAGAAALVLSFGVQRSPHR